MGGGGKGAIAPPPRDFEAKNVLNLIFKNIYINKYGMINVNIYKKRDLYCSYFAPILHGNVPCSYSKL